MPKKPTKSKSDGISVRRMTIWLMIAVAYVFWGIAASTHIGRVFELVPVSGRGGGLLMAISGLATFLINSLRIDAIFAVFTNSLRNHLWHFWLFVIAECTVLGFGIWLKHLEEQLKQPTSRLYRSGK